MDDEMKLEIEATIAEDDPEELLGVIIELALSAEDLEWAEDCCIRLAKHSDTNVRGNAIIGFAHLAERFGDLLVAQQKAAVRKLATYHSTRGWRHARIQPIVKSYHP